MDALASSLFFFLFCIACYLLGSINTAILVSRILKTPDPRLEGSNNPGATNMLRTAGKFPAFLTLLGDFMKSWLPLTVAALLGLSKPGIILAGVCTIIGHLFPLFFHFKGGKGVATAFGVFFATSPLLGLATASIWLVVAKGLKLSSLSALIASFASPFLAHFWWNDWYVTLGIAVIAGLIFYRHKENIQRLISGQEKAITSKDNH